MRLVSGLGLALLASVVVATGAFGGSGATAPKPTLAVVVVGSGSVVSTPAGISCPGRCSATFAAGSRVLLTPRARSGARFLRWGGDCTGARACRVKVSGLAAVAAQFVGSTAKPPPPASSVEPGTYAGSAAGRSLTFFVPAGARSVSTFSTRVFVTCAGGPGVITDLNVLTATIKPDRSFTATTSQTAVVNGASAKLTYAVTGRFQGRSATGAATADGVLRVDIVFADTPSRKCTSNDQPWTAARSQPPQTGSIEPGEYSGSAAGRSLTFFVPAGARTVSNFSTRVFVTCAGGPGVITDLKILTATIKSDRSFSATTSQTGVVNGANAKLTYAVTGSFQGFSSTGAAGAAGVLRVDLVFTDTPNRHCTSNDQPWTAARIR